MKIELDELREELRIAKSCADCPRYHPECGQKLNEYCKGHLYWICNKINALEGDAYGQS